MEVTVAVGTFGEPYWADLARARAIPSATSIGMRVVYVHADTLQEARNGALAQVDTEWVIHLDGDDELEPGYTEAMATGTADVRAPAVRYIHPNGKAAWPGLPRVAGHQHACVADCLTQGNWLIVGSAIRAELVRQVGGWWDEPVYEDWSLWLRCHMAGATFEAIPAAIYRAHVRPSSRNRGTPMAIRNRMHGEILRSVGL